MGFLDDISNGAKQFFSKDNQLGKEIQNNIDPTKLVNDAIEQLKKFFVDTLKKEIYDPVMGFVQTIIDKVDEIRFYMNCSIDKIKNFWVCCIWYIILIWQEIIHFIIIAIAELFGALGIYDFKSMYLKVLDLIREASDVVEEYTGMTLFIFPYSDSINAKCFSCDPLKESKMEKLKKSIKEGTTYIKNEIKDTIKGNVQFFKEQVNDITT